MSTLFRPQAVDHQRQRPHGTIVLTRSWSSLALVGVLLACVAALLVFAACFGFTRKEVLSGVVVPVGGQVRVAAPQTGLLTAVHVEEGQAVQAGDMLFSLSGERTNSLGNTEAAINSSLQARVQALTQEIAQRAEQARIRQADLEARSRSLKASLAQQDAELLLQKQRTQLAQEVAARWADLARQGAQTQAAAQDKAADALDQATRLSALERATLALRRESSELNAQRVDLPHLTAREALALRRDIEQIKQQRSESEARREIGVRAERAGRIAGIVPRVGQWLSQGDRLAQLLPLAPTLEAELYAPTRAIAFVRTGTPVLLRYEAFPFQKFGQHPGAVRDVALVPVPLQELQDRRPGDTTNINTEPVYRIRVQLAAQDVQAGGQRFPLRPGMPLQASLMLEHRSLLEWALEPLLGLKQRL